MPISSSDAPRRSCRRRRRIVNTTCTIVCAEEQEATSSSSNCSSHSPGNAQFLPSHSPILALEPHFSSEGECSRSPISYSLSDISLPGCADNTDTSLDQGGKFRF